MKVVVAKTQQEIVDNFLVRGEVFIIGQSIDWRIEFDGQDQSSVLFTAYDNDKAIGAARLLGNKIGRVATLESYRKQGVGKLIMDKIEEYATENNIQYLILNAQLYVKDFYVHLGYEVQGEVFKEADIEHIKMSKEIK